MAQTDGTTVGVWFSADSGLLDRIDDRVNWRYGSRSEWLRDAAQMRLMVDDALDGVGMTFDNEQEKRSYVRQLILNDN